MRFNSSFVGSLAAFAALIVTAAPALHAGTPSERSIRTIYGPDQTALGFYVAAAGDANNDGTPDYAITSLRGDGYGGSVSLFSGADGSVLRTFTGAEQIDFFGMSLANAGDIDHDGYSDLIIGSPMEIDINLNVEPPTFHGMHSAVEVYSGFTGARIYRTESDQSDDAMGWSVANAGDVTGDSLADVVAGAPFWGGDDRGRVLVISSTDHEFPLEFSWPNHPGEQGFSVAGAGDLNNDGFAEVLFGIPGCHSALTLDMHNNQSVNTWVQSTASSFFGGTVANAGDLTGDGVNELIVGGKNGPLVVVYNGATGVPHRAYAGPSGSHFGYAVANAGDFDGDGVNDVAVGAPQFKRGFSVVGRISVYSGATCGLIDSIEGSPGAPYFGDTLAGVGDIDGDGYGDLLVGAPGSGGAAYLFAGRANELAMSVPRPYSTGGTTPSFVTTADIDRDGWADVLSVNPTTGKLAVQINKRDGTFKTAKLYTAGKGANSLVVSDLDKDGDLDVVVTASKENKLVFLRNYPALGKLVADGTLTVPSKPTSIVSADFNADGHKDLAIACRGDNSVVVMLNNGVGTQRFQTRFASKKKYAVGIGAVCLQTGDMNMDFRPDLVVANSTTDEISVLLCGPAGNFHPRQVVATPHRPISIALADINLDQNLDIACICTGIDQLYLYHGSDDGSFQDGGSLPVGHLPRAVIARDLNGDRFVDLAVANKADNNVSVLMNNASGLLSSAINQASHTSPVWLGAADVDGDGDQDVLTISGDTGKMSVLMNRWIH